MADEIKTPKRFGWLPELPDQRDYSFAKAAPKLATIDAPAGMFTEAADKVLGPFDQGYTGSCVGFAVGLLYSFVHNKARRSELQIYYEARRLLGDEFLTVDSGSHIRDAVKYVCNYGAGRNSFWPNVETDFDVDPPEFVDRDALKRKKGVYYALNSGADYQRCCAEGFPFVIGATVYSSWWTALSMEHGIVTMPSGNIEGGHAFLVMPNGYIADFHNHPAAKAAVAAGRSISQIPTRAYHCRNSWGNEIQYNGDFFIDADYLENLNYADDAWTIRLA